jgi:hypothetical protein
MPVLFYKDPSTGVWEPFGTSDPVADEVQITSTPPIDPLVDLWVDPSGTGTEADWPVYDARYVSRTNAANAAMTVPLTLSGPPSANLHAATKAYVDTAALMVTNATAAAHMPIASVTLFAGKYLAPGWHYCDGTPHNSWALQTALESPNSPDLPAPSGMSYIIYGGS